MKKILIIEDDKALIEALTTSLETENFKVISATDGEQGFRTACQEKIDLIILDLVLPSLGGMEICQMLRAKGNMTPIVILTGKKKEEIDRVVGLELGADDYIIKPFGTKELLARIKAVLRRSKPEVVEFEEYSFGDVYVNFKKQIASKGKNILSLTAKEFGLLKLLTSHEGEVVSRDTILNEVWGYDKFPTTRTVDTFIHNLRQKIEDNASKPAHLITIPWSGYKFVK
ncbi:MAG: response regulator transcription factor [Candidatus Aminicenantes bacterium]|nr:MAG: response regulator transcription factor [Candidatus Aminicenantes bacterium]